MKDILQEKDLNEYLTKKPTEEIIDYTLETFGDKVAFSSSMGAEDQVITHMLSQRNKPVNIFTLDTGRLFQETYDLIEETNKHFGIEIEIIFPDYKKVQQMVREKGINLFYRSIENRKLCCSIRKKEPIERTLKGMKAWISGLRKDQSVERFFTPTAEWDETYKLYKINPLLEWTEKQVWDYIRKHNIPYNKLHDKDFRSIGCQPCTRAIKPEDDFRAGRWWWEEKEKKECGLHS